MVMKNLKHSSTLKIDEKKCIGCGLCTEVCPHAALYVENRKVHIRDIDVCMECGGCSKKLPGWSNFGPCRCWLCSCDYWE